MKRTITWIRHGQSDWNAEGRWQGHTDTALSELGERQAQALSERVRKRRFDAVFSSDLKRSVETCRLALPGVEHTVDARLREMNFGIFEGKSWSLLTDTEREAVGGWWVEPYLEKLEGGESMECLNSRVAEFLAELPTKCEIAIFTHGGVIRNAVWQVVGPPAGGGWSVQLDNTSLTVIEYTASRNLIHCVNDSAHLEALSGR